MRCNRYQTKQKYIDFLQAKVDKGKKNKKTPVARLAKLLKMQKSLEKKKLRVLAYLNKNKCLSIKKSPFCSKVSVNTKCDKGNDVFGEKMRSIKARIMEVTAKKAKLCQKKAAPKKGAATCPQLNSIKAQIKSVYVKQTKTSTNLSNLTKALKAKKTPITKPEQLNKDKVSQLNQKLKAQVVALLRKAREAKKDCDNKKK